MSNPPEAKMLARSPLAVSTRNYSEEGLNDIRFFHFFQDPQGRIRCIGPNGGSSVIVVDTARDANLNNGFAAVGWNNGDEVRLYYTNRAGQMYERCYSRNRGEEWYPGDLNGQYKAAAYSQLAAVHFWNNNEQRTHIYYQHPDTDEIREVWRRDNSIWFTQTKPILPAAIKSTGLAAYATSDPSTGEATHIQLWFQEPNTKFTQYVVSAEVFREDWEKGSFTSQLEYDPGASISATNDKVFTVSKDNKLALTPLEETNEWGPSSELIDQIPYASVAAIEHLMPYDSPYTTTVLCQKEAGEITLLGVTDANDFGEVKPSPIVPT